MIKAPQAETRAPWQCTHNYTIVLFKQVIKTLQEMDFSPLAVPMPLAKAAPSATLWVETHYCQEQWNPFHLRQLPISNLAGIEQNHHNSSHLLLMELIPLSLCRCSVIPSSKRPCAARDRLNIIGSAKAMPTMSSARKLKPGKTTSILTQCPRP